MKVDIYAAKVHLNGFVRGLYLVDCCANVVAFRERHSEVRQE